MEINVSKKEKSEMEITGEVPVDVFESHRKEAVKYLSSRMNIPGFRKGKAPEDVVTLHAGDMAVLEEMAERALSRAYPEIVREHALDVIGDPAVQITKIAKGSPLGFKINVAVSPEVILPDYKKIAGKVNEEPIPDVIATDEEVDKTIDEIRKLRSRTIPMGNEKEKGAEEKTNVDAHLAKESEPLTDESVKDLGDFENIADLRAKIRINIRAEKEAKEKEKRRGKLMEELVKESKIEVPHILVERELDRLLTQFASDVSRMGLQFDKYLEHVKKTIADIRLEWSQQAERNVKTGLVLHRIAEDEKIEADTEMLEKEVKHIIEHYPGAREDRARAYAATILKHEEVFKFLEGQK